MVPQAVWDAFARVWDAVVEDLRGADLISDREQDNLRFMRLPAGHCRVGAAGGLGGWGRALRPVSVGVDVCTASRFRGA